MIKNTIDIKIYILALKPGDSPFISEDKVKEDMRIVNERFAQINSKANYKIVEKQLYVPGVDLNDGFTFTEDQIAYTTDKKNLF